MRARWHPKCFKIAQEQTCEPEALDVFQLQAINDELIAALERIGATASVLHHNSGRVDAALLATMVKGIADEASAAIAAAEGSKCSVAAAKAETSVT